MVKAGGMVFFSFIVLGACAFSSSANCAQSPAGLSAQAAQTAANRGGSVLADHEELAVAPDSIALLHMFHGKRVASATTDLSQILDSKAMHRASQSDYVKSHFLTYIADGGFNNRLQSLQISLILAVALNRTLIIQHFTEGHNSGAKVPYTGFLEEIDFWPVTTDSSQVDKMDWADAKLGPHSNCQVDVTRHAFLLKKTAGEKQLIRYGSAWGYWRSLFASEQHSTILKFLSQHVRFKKSFIADVRNLSIPRPYALVHFRLGDRPGLSMANCTRFFGYKLGVKKSWRAALGRPSRSTGCVKLQANGTIDYLKTEPVAESWQIPNDIRHIYIATNKPENPRVPRLKRMFQQRNLSVLLWEDLVSPAESELRDGSLVSAYEQILATEAEVFLPSWPSSWDSVVVDRRAWEGKLDAEWQTQFYLESLLRHLQRFRNLKCNYSDPDEIPC